ncbi:hypothetical protein SAMN06265361_10934 [Laceyella tengchongensis]|uniref:Uncharacterized protein n=1 Tax=Laceyella tengchongensis TaxID=574699 RepID=A0AA46AGX9_9BACL|nr:hypothetical protein SAMN06265361_10934 [Laceyella tengchongensis]
MIVLISGTGLFLFLVKGHYMLHNTFYRIKQKHCHWLILKEIFLLSMLQMQSMLLIMIEQLLKNYLQDYAWYLKNMHL